jgi:hypothetical protein
LRSELSSLGKQTTRNGSNPGPLRIKASIRKLLIDWH